MISLEDLQAAMLDEPLMEVLGDTISYKPIGAAWRTLKAYVDHTDALRSIESAQVISQDVSLQLLKSQVPARPSAGVLIRLPKVAGKTFKPVNVRSDTSGDYWEFELVMVNG